MSSSEEHKEAPPPQQQQQPQHQLSQEEIANRIMNLSPYDIVMPQQSMSSGQLYGVQAPIQQSQAFPTIPSPYGSGTYQQPNIPPQIQPFTYSQPQQQQIQQPQGHYQQPQSQPPAMQQQPSSHYFQPQNQQLFQSQQQFQPVPPQSQPQQIPPMQQEAPSRFQHQHPLINPLVSEQIKQQQMSNPVGLLAQQMVYPQRTPQQRQMFIQDLILKYPDILTNDEQKRMNRYKDFMMFSLVTGIVTMPYSVILAIRARKNPMMRSYYLKRMALLPVIPLFILLGSGYLVERNFVELGQKYFSNLSDQDLDNFENYYAMVKQQYQPLAAVQQFQQPGHQQYAQGGMPQQFMMQQPNQYLPQYQQQAFHPHQQQYGLPNQGSISQVEQRQMAEGNKESQSEQKDIKNN